MTAATPFVIGSLAKSMTALAVLQLVEAGRIDLDASVTRYLPAFTLADPADAALITVRELLTHTSGIPTAAGVAPLSGTPTTLAGQVDALRSVTPGAAPGAAYAYSNANYLVLGRLVEVVAGVPYGAYLEDHLFGPLGMAHATTDPATAAADGLGEAHRLFFGLAVARPPLFREDLAPAGFVAASADDMGRYLLAQLGERDPGARPVVSASSLATMHAGAVATGVPGERMGMGWADGILDGEPILSHAGSTTDMAALQVMVPGRRLGVAVLFDAQSVPYELLHKPDAIGLGVVSLLTGHVPGGTLALFYPAFDLAVLALVGLLLRDLGRAIRRARRRIGVGGDTAIAPAAMPATFGLDRPAGRPAPAFGRLASARRRIGRGAALGLAVYLDLVVPAAILLGAPGLLGAGWGALVRIDVGLVLLVVAALRLATGAARLAAWLGGRRGRAAAVVPVGPRASAPAAGA